MSYNFRIFTNLFIIFIFVFFFGQADAQKKRRERNKSSKNKSLKIIKNTENNFFRGLHQFLLERPEKALEYFLLCEKVDAQIATIQYLIARCYLQLQQYDKSLTYIQKAIKLEEDNINYYDILLDIKLLSFRYEEILDIYDLILKNVKKPALSYYVQYMNVSSLTGNNKKSLEVAEAAEKKFGWNPSIIYQKIENYKALKDYEKALLEGDKLIKNYPYITEYKISQAQLYLKREKYEEAEKLLNSILKYNSKERIALILLCKLYNETGRKEDGQVLAKEIFEDSSFDVELKLVLFFALENYDYDEEILIKYCEIMALHHDDNSDVNILNATNLKDKDQSKSRYYYKKALNDRGDQIDIWFNVLDLDFKLEQYDSALVDATDAIEYFPNNNFLYLYLGNAHFILKDYKKAKESLEFGKSILTNALNFDSTQLKQFNIILADIYYNLEEYDNAYETYETVLAYDSNNAHVLNNYSYYLSLRKEKLDLAEEMCIKLMSLEGNNPTFLDTYGWVLFQLGKTEEAIQYLEKAVKLDDDVNYVILDHLGDALFKLDKKERAIKVWKQALETAKESDKMKIQEKLDKVTN